MPAPLGGRIIGLTMSPHPPLRVPVRLLLAALLLPACVARPRAPENLFSAEWTFMSAGAREEIGPGSTDTNLNGVGLTWEAFAVSKDSNLAFSYLRRRNKAENARGRTFDADVVRVQWRWQSRFPHTQDWFWYVGPGLGWVVSASEDPAGASSYRGGLYLDGEVGFRYRFWDPVGLTALVNIDYLDVDGRNPASPVAQATAMSFAVGIYADF